VSVWLAADSTVIVGAGSHPVRSDFSRPGYSLMAGEVASLLLSRMTVPILYTCVKNECITISWQVETLDRERPEIALGWLVGESATSMEPTQLRQLRRSGLMKLL
jgi:hypothetical protein